MNSNIFGYQSPRRRGGLCSKNDLHIILPILVLLMTLALLTVVFVYALAISSRICTVGQFVYSMTCT